MSVSLVDNRDTESSEIAYKKMPTLEISTNVVQHQNAAINTVGLIQTIPIKRKDGLRKREFEFITPYGKLAGTLKGHDKHVS